MFLLMKSWFQSYVLMGSQVPCVFYECGATKILPVGCMRLPGLYLDCPDMEHRREDN